MENEVNLEDGAKSSVRMFPWFGKHDLSKLKGYFFRGEKLHYSENISEYVDEIKRINNLSVILTQYEGDIERSYYKKFVKGSKIYAFFNERDKSHQSFLNGTKGMISRCDNYRSYE